MKLTKQQALQKIEELKKYIEVEDKKESGYWEPEDGEKYYWIDGYGQVECNEWNEWNGWAFGHGLLSIGNVFRTEEEAQRELDKLKALTKIRKYIAEHDMEFVPDWEDEEQRKLYICYDPVEKCFDWVWSSRTQYLAPFFFASEKHAEQVIEDCEDELKVLFGVKN